MEPFRKEEYVNEAMGIGKLMSRLKSKPTEYKILYHGTNKNDASGIVRRGFRGRKGAGEGGLSDDINKKKSVYMTDDPQKADTYADTKREIIDVAIVIKDKDDMYIDTDEDEIIDIAMNTYL